MPPTTVPNNQNAAIKQAIIDFDREMRYLLESGDTSRISNYAAGTALQDRYTAEDVLRRAGNCVWKYDHRGISFTSIDMQRSTLATVYAVVDRDGTMYCGGVEQSQYAFVGPRNAVYTVSA